MLRVRFNPNFLDVVDHQHVTENSTIGIDLSKDWTNTSLTSIHTERPSGLFSLSSEALWFDDKRNVIYSFGGDNLDMYYKNLFDLIQSFTLDGKGSGEWIETVGRVGKTPFPSDIHSPSSGMFTNDVDDAYYLGGWISFGKTSFGPGDHHNNTDLLKFNFESLTITTLESPDLMIDYGALVNVPIYGPNGVLLAFGGKNGQTYRFGVGFNNINVFDKKEGKWYSQIAEGDIPLPRVWFCAVGVHDKRRTSFEM